MIKKLLILLYIQIIYAKFHTVEQFKKSWYENVNKELDWERPKRSSDFEYDESSCKDYSIYDFIIVGTGTAGAVIATRLSEIFDKTVLTLEAGGDETDYSLVPGVARDVRISEKNWGFVTTPQLVNCKAMVNTSCSFEAGKGLGGSSGINGLTLTKGSPYEFDEWERLGNFRWSYKDVLPYFIKSENASTLIGNPEIILDSDYHGFHGPLSVSTNIPPPPLADIILQGFEENGLYRTDYNGERQIGISLSQANVKYGLRASTNQAYLQKVKYRKNLNILINSLAIEILFDKSNKTAKGVKFINNNQCYYAYAKHEVIISGGTINSPKLLMLSGIGPKKHLEKFNIPVKANLPVGKNLRDQVAVNAITINTNQSVPSTTFDEDINDFLQQKGYFTYNDNYQVVFLRLFGDVADSEISCYLNQKYTTFNITFKASNYIESMRNVLLNRQSNPSQIICNAVLLATDSIGEVTLKSADPLDYPNIDPKSFNERSDLENLISLLIKVEEIFQSKTFKSVNATFIGIELPQCPNTLPKRHYWKCVIEQVSSTYIHEIGTCKMGLNDGTSVVNHNLRVHGINNLMVVDASVIPIITRGHTMFPVTAIAEKISDYLKTIYM